MNLGDFLFWTACAVTVGYVAGAAFVGLRYWLVTRHRDDDIDREWLEWCEQMDATL